MPKKPTGSRPRPAVARGKGRATASNNSMRSYPGTRGSKSPTGSRPRSAVAKDTAPVNPSKHDARPAATAHPMTASRASQYNGKSRAHGGGSGKRSKSNGGGYKY